MSFIEFILLFAISVFSLGWLFISCLKSAVYNAVTDALNAHHEQPVEENDWEDPY